MSLLWSLLTAVGVLSVAMTVASLLSWVERRMLGVWQDRRGPNRLGPLGAGVVLADAIKLLAKEDRIPPFTDKFVFVIAPPIVMIAGLFSFAILPFADGVSVIDLSIGLLFFLAMSGLSTYSVILAGWSSNNKYALLGGLRAAAQMMSYEIFMGMSLMGVVVITGTTNLNDIVRAQSDIWFIIPQFLGFILFFIAALGETHRAPFDLPEAESEIVAGYHTEYSGIKFGMFMLGEYLGVALMSSIMASVWFGGWQGPIADGPWWLFIKSFCFVLLFILIRATLPRPRNDQLLKYGWTILFPLSLLNLLLTAAAVLWLGESS